MNLKHFCLALATSPAMSSSAHAQCAVAYPGVNPGLFTSTIGFNISGFPQSISSYMSSAAQAWSICPGSGGTNMRPSR